jgi:hypothetical protein
MKRTLRKSGPYAGLCLLAMYGLHCHDAKWRPTPKAPEQPSEVPLPTPPPGVVDPLAAQADVDPLAFLKVCRERYEETVQDYRCVFRKQELLEDGLSPEQVILIRFREQPFSVDMRWVENAARASRVTYQRNRWVEDGRQMAYIQPSGLLGLLAPHGVKRAIHGAAMMAESRRPVDNFGFKNTLDLIIDDCELFQDDAGYELWYAGVTTFADRQCYVIERRLPYVGEDGPYPNRGLTVFIDREWLVPLGTLAYADDAGTELLGSYVLSDVEFNVGLTDEDFAWEAE